jgi:hypothetical protein
MKKSFHMLAEVTEYLYENDEAMFAGEVAQ